MTLRWYSQDTDSGRGILLHFRQKVFSLYDVADAILKRLRAANRSVHMAGCQ